MPKKTFHIILLISVSLIAVYGVYCFIQKANAPTIPLDNNGIIDPLNATYNIENQPINLINGRYEKATVPGSSTLTRYSVWGEPAYGDFNGDGTSDAAIVIVGDGGSSGTFYYLAAIMGEKGTDKGTGTNGALLGDRITMQRLYFRDRRVVAEYLDRKTDEPMTSIPTIQMSPKFIVENGIISQVPDAEFDGNNCLKSGGRITTTLCCQSVSDFPNTCMIGACGCSPVYSHQVQACECQEGKCFDGSQCVDIK